MSDDLESVQQQLTDDATEESKAAGEQDEQSEVENENGYNMLQWSVISGQVCTDFS